MASSQPLDDSKPATATTAAPPEKKELVFVDFEGDSDPLHPWNWPLRKRYGLSPYFSH